MTGSVLEEAAAAARRGALVVLPTDTVYGIGTRPDDRSATARLFEAKERPRGLTLPVLVASLEDARRVAVMDERAERLAGAAWPGPLTIVLPRSADALGWDLGGEAATVGVRIPAHPLAVSLLAATGPLAVTSANRSGEPPARTCDELVAAFGDAVAVYLCEDHPLEGRSSTVVDLTGDGPRILREGEVTERDLRRYLSGEGPLLDSRPS
ncbi:MAG: L-threonylcarbamoyladenylate synthase [Planctomycetaceae bacterium]